MSGTPMPLFQSAGVTRLGFFHLPQTGIAVAPFHSKSSVFVLSHSLLSQEPLTHPSTPPVEWSHALRVSRARLAS